MFDGPCQYDLILGRDFLHKIGLQLDFANAKMCWMEHLVPMRDDASLKESNCLELEDEVDIDAFTSEILDTKYEQVDPVKVA